LRDLAREHWDFGSRVLTSQFLPCCFSRRGGHQLGE
jgi:hypothetical protein